jgi:hypothetical protein
LSSGSPEGKITLSGETQNALDLGKNAAIMSFLSPTVVIMGMTYLLTLEVKGTES